MTPGLNIAILEDLPNVIRGKIDSEFHFEWVKGSCKIPIYRTGLRLESEMNKVILPYDNPGSSLYDELEINPSLPFSKEALIPLLKEWYREWYTNDYLTYILDLIHIWQL